LVIAHGTVLLAQSARAAPLPAEVGQLSRRLSGPVHGLPYVLIFIILILDIATFIWHGRVFDFGLFRLNFGVRSNRAIFHPSEDIHGYLACWLIAVLKGLNDKLARGARQISRA